MVEGSHRHKVSKLPREGEVLERDANVHLIIEGYSVEKSFQAAAVELVVDERFLWQQIEVLLQSGLNHFVGKLDQSAQVGQLALEHGHVTVGVGDQREVLRRVQVVVLHPLKDEAQLFHEVVAFK